MTEHHKNSTEERLIAGYNKMLKRMHEALEQASQNARPKFMQAMEIAKEKAIALAELSEREAEKLGEYIQRDVNDAAEFLVESERDLGEWLAFDMELVENWFWEAFKSVADQTRLELDAIRLNANGPAEYHTGEVTGPGALQCDDCEKVIHFHRTGHIPPCSGCHGTHFSRVAAE